MGRPDEENPQSDEDTPEPEKQRLRTDEEDGIELKKIPVKVKDAEYPVIIGTRQDCIKTSHLKYALLTFNFLLSVLGLVLLSLAIWIRADPEFWEYDTTLKIDDYYKVCYMFIVVGFIILIVGFLGCCGAVMESQGLLVAYFVVFSIIFVIELSAVVMIWSAPFSKKLTDEIGNQILRQVKNRERDDSSRFFMDFIQEHIECCGSETHKEYANSAPNSCQDSVSGILFPEGCTKKMVNYLRQKAGIIGGMALPILLFQVLGLLSAGCLIKNIKRESRYVM